MKNTDIGMRLLGALLAGFLCAGASQAQVYKWKDAKGDWHYSNNKADADRAAASEVKIPKEPQGSAQPQRQYQPITAAPQADPRPSGQAGRPQRSQSGGREDGSDASRCALARDVLNGSVRHPNGKPTDKYDIEVAQNDVKMFCK